MQSEGSSYGPSARDGGLLDSMKTLKSPNRSLQFSEDPPPTPFTHPSQPHPTLFPFLQHSHHHQKHFTVWLYSLPEGACCRDTELNWTRQSLSRNHVLSLKIQKASIWRLFCQYPLQSALPQSEALHWRTAAILMCAQTSPLHRPNTPITLF